MTTRSLSRTLPGLLFVLICSIAFTTAGARGEDGLSTDQANQFIEALANDTLSVLSEQNLPFDEKEAQVKAIIDHGFDLPFISRFVLGRFWRNATDAQRSEYQELFRRGVVDSYTRALVSAGGTGFQVLDSARVSPTDIVVNSRLEREEGPPIGAGWRVRMIGGVPKIIDVVHEGVSLALTQRQEYASVIERQGMEGLLEILRKRG